MLRAFVLLFVSVWPPVAQAHPHVFVDVALRFLPDDEGRIAGVEVTWTYDDFFSLLVLEDRGLDPEGDMVLTDAERAALIGFDLSDWPEGFDGALFLYDRGQKVTLGAPQPMHLSLEAGKIVTRHIRRFDPMDPGEIIVRPYDPSYYAALGLTQVSGLPAGCAARITPADTEAADALVAGLGGATDEAMFDEVAVGIHYADTLEIACAPRS